MKSTVLIFIFLIVPLLTFASTETSKSVEFVFDSLKLQTQKKVIANDSLVVKKLPDYEKIAKTSGILGIISFGTMLVLGIISSGGLAVLIGSALSFVALILGLFSVQKVKNKKWARLGIILGSLGLLALAAWIAFIFYVISLLVD
jgi:hypothetical protein